MESWIEEDIRPNTGNDMDRVLVEHIGRMVDYLKQKPGYLESWHFLRESTNWRGQGKNPPFIHHIRFRVRTRPDSLRDVEKYLTDELNKLRSIGEILDYYPGNHGTPTDSHRTPTDRYAGEALDYDEPEANPKGWIVAQKWLEAGSEVELVLLANRFHKRGLGKKFNSGYLCHLFCNQCALAHDQTAGGWFMIIQAG